MHLLTECLPLLAGPIALILFRQAKSRLAKWAAVVLLPMLFAVLANTLSAEGPALLWADLLKAYGCTACLLLLKRPMLKARAKASTHAHTA